MRTESGDEPSFEEFMAARWSALFRTAYLLTGDTHEAEDLLQNALAKTCVKWDSIRAKDAADAYVRRSMFNQMSRQWRWRRREQPVDQLPDVGHHGGLAGRDERMVLWEAIRQLPPRMRVTLVLRYFEDLSETETARQLDCSIGTVKAQTHHALRRLRVALPDLQLTLNGDHR